MSEITLQIDGMHCGACVRRVSQALAATSGLNVKEVRIGAARLESEEPEAEAKAIEALAKAGYKAHTETTVGR
jgi:copper chaperone CopZ